MYKLNPSVTRFSTIIPINSNSLLNKSPNPVIINWKGSDDAVVSRATRFTWSSSGSCSEWTSDDFWNNFFVKSKLRNPENLPHQSIKLKNTTISNSSFWKSVISIQSNCSKSSSSIEIVKAHVFQEITLLLALSQKKSAKIIKFWNNFSTK